MVWLKSHWRAAVLHGMLSRLPGHLNLTAAVPFFHAGKWLHVKETTEIGEGKMFSPGNLRATFDNPEVGVTGNLRTLNSAMASSFAPT